LSFSSGALNMIRTLLAPYFRRLPLRHCPFGRDYGATVRAESPQKTYMRVLRPCEYGPSRDGPKGVNARVDSFCSTRDCNSTTRSARVSSTMVSPSKGSQLVTLIRRAYPEECWIGRAWNSILIIFIFKEICITHWWAKRSSIIPFCFFF